MNHSIHTLAHHLVVSHQSSSASPPQHPLHVQQKHLARAAVRILGANIKPHLDRLTTITMDQHKKIQHEVKKLEIARINRKEKKNQKKKSAHAMINELRKHPVDITTTNTTAQSQIIESLFEDYYQIAGCKIAYGEWGKGDVILGPHPDLSNYKVHKIIKNNKGLQLVCLVPTKPDEHCPPIICCRGTTSNPHNFVDDMKKNIGVYSVAPSLKEIEDTLKEMTRQYGSVVFTGHSLGGAVAQVLAARFFDSRLEHSNHSHIKALYTYNSPGAGEEVKKEYIEKKTKNPALAPTIYYYYHAGDIVVLAGRGRVPATKRIRLGAYSFFAFLRSPIQTIRNAHSWKHRISQFKTEKAYEWVNPQSSGFERIIRGISEFFRRTFGIIGQRIILFYLLRREQEKEKTEQLRKQLFQNLAESILIN